MSMKIRASLPLFILVFLFLGIGTAQAVPPKKEYNIYLEQLRIEPSEQNGYDSWCNCYYFAKFAHATEFIKIMNVSRLTYSMAAAATRDYAANDPDICPFSNCWGGGNPPVGVQRQQRQNQQQPPPPEERSNGNSYESCRDKYCPDCKSAINLLGQSASSSCQACVNQKHKLISQCQKGSRSQSNNDTDGPVNIFADNNNYSAVDFLNENEFLTNFSNPLTTQQPQLNPLPQHPKNYNIVGSWDLYILSEPDQSKRARVSFYANGKMKVEHFHNDESYGNDAGVWTYDSSKNILEYRLEEVTAGFSGQITGKTNDLILIGVWLTRIGGNAKLRLVRK